MIKSLFRRIGAKEQSDASGAAPAGAQAQTAETAEGSSQPKRNFADSPRAKRARERKERRDAKATGFMGMQPQQWDDYDALEMEIQKGQAFATAGLIGVPVALLVVIGGISLFGSEHIAMAVGVPTLFVGGIIMIGANIQRLQVKRLKRIRDNWGQDSGSDGS
ncbi:hypothetical protein CKO15_11615 [Halorhodospira abdelmalekii]|uniref:hypothetical protein n=1 Tax=Halorhodospira abdelmalekii TaxID=421629 RepID=UPI00190755EF|nr:hypothetical protein [Halorhodospira abdelmalekii]MBK1735913.1 hypothetical protein [Halorhodospira abdelmalekii]